MNATAPAPGSPEDSQRFLNAIRLEDHGEDHRGRLFSAVPQYVPWGKAYGGDMVAQALAAAATTVDAGRPAHSTHSYFLRPVTAQEPVTYEVMVVRDGRGFSTRRVTGIQDGREVYLAIMSFAVPDGTDFFGAASASTHSRPEDLPSTAEYLAANEALGTPAADYWAYGRSFDLRHDPQPVYLARSDPQPAQAVWVKAFSPIPADPLTQQLALAYVCDYTILETALRTRSLGWSAAGLSTASVDHAMWFHRPGNLNDWTLYQQDAISVQDGRGLASGRFYGDAGTLLATVMQEGVIRYQDQGRTATQKE